MLSLMKMHHIRMGCSRCSWRGSAVLRSLPTSMFHRKGHCCRVCRGNLYCGDCFGLSMACVGGPASPRYDVAAMRWVFKCGYTCEPVVQHRFRWYIRNSEDKLWWEDYRLCCRRILIYSRCRLEEECIVVGRAHAVLSSRIES